MFGFTTDAEGPLVLNDNAEEIYRSLVGGGYPVLSKWVVYRFEVEKDPRYKAGDTLRIIVPFLKAHGATNRGLEEFSRETIRFVPGAKETLRHISEKGCHSAIISTSYAPYVRALCDITGFCFDDAYCTEFDIDRYPINDAESRVLRAYAREISGMKVPEWRRGTESVEGFDQEHADTVQRLNSIFDDVLCMDIGKAISEIEPVGGPGKAAALHEFSKRSGIPLRDTLYRGDSITDVAAFRSIRKDGGLAVSFNGNGYAVDEADIAIMSPNTRPSSAVADVFERKGKREVLQMAREWHDAVTQKCLGDFGVSPWISESISGTYDQAKRIPSVVFLDGNMNEIGRLSESFRKTVRGQAGNLV